MIARTEFIRPNVSGAQPGTVVTTKDIFIPAGSFLRVEQQEEF